MKRILPILSLAGIIVACNPGPKPAADAVVQQPVTSTIDTAGLAEFRMWKTLNEVEDVNEFNKAEDEVAPKAEAKKAEKSYKAPVRKTSKKSAVASKPSTASNSGSKSSAGSGESDNSGAISQTSESGETAKASEKKGWSKAAKGAVIGGASGAIAGAVINKKNRAAGAVIGGVIGAGGGYVLGRQMDKKDGRVN